jgi:hypothetical protein
MMMRSISAHKCVYSNSLGCRRALTFDPFHEYFFQGDKWVDCDWDPACCGNKVWVGSYLAIDGIAVNVMAKCIYANNLQFLHLL